MQEQSEQSSDGHHNSRALKSTQSYHWDTGSFQIELGSVAYTVSDSIVREMNLNQLHEIWQVDRRLTCPAAPGVTKLNALIWLRATLELSENTCSCAKVRNLAQMLGQQTPALTVQPVCTRGKAIVGYVTAAARLQQPVGPRSLCKGSVCALQVSLVRLQALMLESKGQLESAAGEHLQVGSRTLSCNTTSTDPLAALTAGDNLPEDA